MPLQIQKTAPAFNTKDVFGNTISLTNLKGKKVYLAFMRFAGCPVCNLRVHELLKSADALKEKNIDVVLVYESSIENIRMYLEGGNYPFTFIADFKNELYNLYQVERSWGKFFSSLFKGLIGRASAGDKLYHKKPAMDGKINRMPAEFLINENGIITAAHYSTYLGDDLPIEKILTA